MNKKIFFLLSRFRTSSDLLPKKKVFLFFFNFTILIHYFLSQIFLETLSLSEFPNSLITSSKNNPIISNCRNYHIYSHKCIQYSFQTGLERAIEHGEIPFEVPFKMLGFFPVFTDKALESRVSWYAS